MRASVLAAAVAAVIATGSNAIEVASCGQVVPAGEVGELLADLNCGAAPSAGDAVGLANGATLVLNNHSVTAPPAGNAVSCAAARRCKIIGPGWLLGAPFPNPTGAGVVVGKKLTIEGDDAAPLNQGIEIYRHTVGIDAGDGKVNVARVFLHNNGDGILAKVVKLANVRIDGSERVGIRAKSVRGESVEIRDCGWAGIETMSFKLEMFSAVSNGFDGTTSGGAIMAAKRGVLRDSHISGNGLNGVPVDIATGRLPVLIDSTCSVSAVLVDGMLSGSWGICVAD